MVVRERDPASVAEDCPTEARTPGGGSGPRGRLLGRFPLDDRRLLLALICFDCSGLLSFDLHLSRATSQPCKLTYQRIYVISRRLDNPRRAVCEPLVLVRLCPLLQPRLSWFLLFETLLNCPFPHCISLFPRVFRPSASDHPALIVFNCPQVHLGFTSGPARSQASPDDSCRCQDLVHPHDMVPSNTYRSKNMDSRTPQPPPGGHAAYTSPSTFSLASSFQSSVASHMSAAAQTSSSHLPDTASSDQPIPLRVAASSSSPKNRFFPPTVAPAPRSSSSAPMGQSSSAAVPSPAASLPPLPLPATASGRLRRAWAGRRKKSEDISTVFNSPPSSDRGYSSDVPPPTSSHSSAFSGDDSEVPAPSYERPPSRTKLFLQSVFKNKNPQSQQQQKSPKFSGSPPVPPPKPAQLQTSKKAPSLPSETSATPEQVSSPIVTSPSISAAIHFINNQDDGKSDKLDVPSSRTDVSSSRTDGKPSAETKQDWRRSDSTMTSYTTIRPGALAGNRSPRPVSLAESSHSGHTIVPINKRLSALIADPEFVMAEESDHEEEALPPPLSRHPSPPSSIKARNRRSASLNHGATFGMWARPTSPESFKPSASESSIPLPRMSPDYVRMTPTTTRDAPTLTRAAAEGFIAPTTAPGAAHSTSSNIRGRLAAWTAATSSSERPPPPQHPRRPNTANNATFRQTAVSMTGGLAPVAFGFGKRAAEKVHRVWGGLSSSTSSHSGYSSSSSLSSSVTPSSYNSGKHADSMGRSASGQSINSQAAPGGWMRRTPNAPSGSWSVNSSQTTSSSTSDSDAFNTPSGPNLGTRLRGPKRNNVGTYIIGGAVFGQNLQLCVRETAIDRVKALLGVPKTSSGMETSGVKPLEERMLPALVVRCAQHIKRWGLQEEGLFR